MRMRYNLEEDELKELYGIQGGKCAICDDPIQLMAKKTHIDHDHESGQVRGILCLGCNLGLGHFRDDPQRLQKAITYLQ